MPLVPYSLLVLRDVLRCLRDDPDSVQRVCTFSCPDLIARPDWIENLFDVSRLPIREDSSAIINWHKAHRLTDAIVDTAALFQALGLQYTAYDLSQARGMETIRDLNEPLPASEHGRYDLVFDCIANQCFDAAQALRNAIAVCRPGGLLLHVLPIQMVNQGYYNISPALFYDLYARERCFELRRCEGVVGVYEDKGRLALSPVNRMRDVPDDAMLLVLARKLPDARPDLTDPVMSKFRNSPNSHR